jgi:hypothetical protein
LFSHEFHRPQQTTEIQILAGELDRGRLYWTIVLLDFDLCKWRCGALKFLHTVRGCKHHFLPFLRSVEYSDHLSRPRATTITVRQPLTSGASGLTPSDGLVAFHRVRLRILLSHTCIALALPSTKRSYISPYSDYHSTLFIIIGHGF